LGGTLGFRPLRQGRSRGTQRVFCFAKNTPHF